MAGLLLRPDRLIIVLTFISSSLQRCTMKEVPEHHIGDSLDPPLDVQRGGGGGACSTLSVASRTDSPSNAQRGPIVPPIHWG